MENKIDLEGFFNKLENIGRKDYHLNTSESKTKILTFRGKRNSKTNKINGA